MRTDHIAKIVRITVPVICLVLVAAAISIISVFAVSETTKVKTAERTETIITGLPSSINKSVKRTVTVKAGITPSNGGRTVKLQRYDSSKKKWKTIYTKTTKDADESAVKFKISGKYRKKTTGKWRLFVTGTRHAREAVSSVITLTSINTGDCITGGKSSCIYCIDTGEFIQTKNCNKKVAQASTTKLMTAILVIEEDKIGATTSISRKAASTPSSRGYIREGDKFSNLDLVYAMMLPSANDAASALAEGVAGNTRKFVNMMNARAKEMDLKNTVYKNPHGLDADGHYSTARDVAILTANAYGHPEIRKAWMTGTRTIKSKNYGISWRLVTTDQMLGCSSNFKGGKTGTQPKAGYCFTGVYKWKGKTYVTVVLGSGSEAGRWRDTGNLHKYIKKYAASKY